MAVVYQKEYRQVLQEAFGDYDGDRVDISIRMHDPDHHTGKPVWFRRLVEYGVTTYSNREAPLVSFKYEVHRA